MIGSTWFYVGHSFHVDLIGLEMYNVTVVRIVHVIEFFFKRNKPVLHSFQI